MINLLKKFIFLLSYKERRQAILIMIMIVIMALLDMVGVALIMPFMAVLTNPSVIETNIFLSKSFEFFNIFGINVFDNFLYTLGICIFIFLILSLGFKALTMYAQIRFTTMRDFSIGKRLLEGYLHQPYSWYLNRNSADLSKNILSEVNYIIGKGYFPLITLISQTAVISAILSLLIFINPYLTFFIFITFGCMYLFIYLFVREYLKYIGKERFIKNESRFSSINEAFGAIKLIKLKQLESFYLNKFSINSYNYARLQASQQTISLLPRYVLEAIAFGGMMIVVLYLMKKSGNFVDAIPLITLYAFAGYRLMPSLQSFYNSITQLRFVGPALEKLCQDLEELKSLDLNKNKKNLILKKNITLSHVNYQYPQSSLKALDDISININAFSSVGIVGSTGSGKTTLVDIILGLLSLKDGKLKIDGESISRKNISSWQNKIGYVPQQVYLSDDTIASNIAFGTDIKDIDYHIIEKVSKISNLHDFVTDQLSEKYQTKVGERGIRLSGGQIQRIGIARALYHDPQLLILDEATSALDNLTEEKIMESLKNIKKKMTLITIAHRLSTVKQCDVIFLLDKGKLVGQGTYNNLRNTNKKFFDLSKNS